MQVESEVKVFCTRCISAVRAQITRVVGVKEVEEGLQEIKVILKCPNCGNAFPYDLPRLKKEAA